MADRDMRRYELFEVKVATFLIGLCGVVSGLSAYGPSESLYVRALSSFQFMHAWAAALIVTGIWTCWASSHQSRPNRHHALTASWLMLWATFGMFVHAGRVTLPSMLIWIHGTAALVTMIVDVHMHARAMERVRGARRGPAIG